MPESCEDRRTLQFPLDNKNMNHLDLFSGIGGFSLAAQRVWGKDHNIVAFVEQDKFCQKILNKHWPHVPLFDDIKDFDGKKYTGTINLLTGGFPCQPFSVAGNQQGKEDDRFLWPEMVRIIQETKPNWIIGENVTGLTNMAQFNSLPDLENQEYINLQEGTIRDIKGPGYLEEILVEIEEMGYDVETFIIPACGVDARHRRDRIWIVAHSECDRRNRRSDSGKGNRTEGQDSKEGRQFGQQSGIRIGTTSGYVADTTTQGLQKWGHESGEPEILEENRTEFSSSDVSDTNSDRLEKHRNEGGRGEISRCRSSNETWSSDSVGERWPIEPNVGRVAHGIPNRVDRLKGLGNAIVPQVAEQIMRGIKELTEQQFEKLDN
jgi:DNA (cytosine-5)-methyltransferase 1